MTKKKFIPIKKKRSGSAAKRDYIKTVERLICILSSLDRGEKVSTAELACELGVTQRTIQRDLDLLNRAGYPLVEVERGRHSFIEGFSLRKVKLSEEQASLLSFMFDISHSLGSKFEESFGDLFKRLMARDLDTPFYAKFPGGPKFPCNEATMKLLESAIDDCKRLSMRYLSGGEEKKEYVLEPLKIALYDGFWYLLAMDVARKKILKLRLERIKNVSLRTETFVPPANLMATLEQSVNIWFDEKRGEKVLLRVAPKEAKYFEQKIFFPLQKIVKKEPDGALILETYPAHPDEISHIIMHWIPCITVVEPQAFKDHIKKAVLEYVGLIS